MNRFNSNVSGSNLTTAGNSSLAQDFAPGISNLSLNSPIKQINNDPHTSNSTPGKLSESSVDSSTSVALKNQLFQTNSSDNAKGPSVKSDSFVNPLVQSKAAERGKDEPMEVDTHQANNNNNIKRKLITPNTVKILKIISHLSYV